LLTPNIQSPAIWYFGEQLAVGDRQNDLLRPLTDAARKTGHGAFLNGYLTGMRAQSPERFGDWLAEMFQSEDTAALGAEVILRSPYAETEFDRCLDALEAGWIDHSPFGLLQFGNSLEAVPLSRTERLFRSLHDRGTPESLRLLIDLMNVGAPDQALPCGPEFAFAVAVETIPGPHILGHHFGYSWSRACEKLVAEAPSLAMPLLEAILVEMGNEYQLSHDDTLEELTKKLVALDPEGAWQVTARQFEGTLPKWRSDLYQWLKGGIRTMGERELPGPIAAIPEHSILAWIEVDPNERAALIAHAAFPTLDDDHGGRLTRQLLIRYGHISGVKAGISASFHSGGWVGPASLHLKGRRETLRKWLAAGFEFQVAQWIEQEIEDHDREIQREEIREERDHFE
jgi:hypothetical protein